MAHGSPLMAHALLSTQRSYNRNPPVDDDIRNVPICAEQWLSASLASSCSVQSTWSEEGDILVLTECHRGGMWFSIIVRDEFSRGWHSMPGAAGGGFGMHCSFGDYRQKLLEFREPPSSPSAQHLGILKAFLMWAISIASTEHAGDTVRSSWDQWDLPVDHCTYN
jgi:hypothetical protein